MVLPEALAPAGAELLAWSHASGTDPHVANWGGGNTSSKAALVDPLTGETVGALRVRGRRRPPSIDTAMHALLPAAHVDHLHPDAVIAVAASADGEALTYRVFKLAAPEAEPAQQFFAAASIVAVNLFDALQNAGPTLTPASMEKGYFELPDSLPGGDFGPWTFEPGRWTPLAGAPTGWYDPNAISGTNGKKGAFTSCAGDDGAYRPWDPALGYGPKGTQLRCFGRG